MPLNKRTTYDENGLPLSAGGAGGGGPFELDASDRIPVQYAPSNTQSIRNATVGYWIGDGSYTYTNTAGAAARGQITNAPLVVNGITMVANYRIFILGYFGPSNGIWTVTTPGSGSNGVWDRAADWDNELDGNVGTLVFIDRGAGASGVNLSNSLWLLHNADPIVIGGASGTTDTYVQITTAQALTAATLPIVEAAKATPMFTPRYNLVASTGTTLINIVVLSDKPHIMVAHIGGGTRITPFERLHGRWQHVNNSAGLGAESFAGTPPGVFIAPAAAGGAMTYVPPTGVGAGHNRIWFLSNSTTDLVLITPSGTFASSTVTLTGGGAGVYYAAAGPAMFYDVTADRVYYVGSANTTIYRVNAGTHTVDTSNATFTDLRIVFPKTLAGVMTEIIACQGGGQVYSVDPTTLAKTLLFTASAAINSGLHVEEFDKLVLQNGTQIRVSPSTASGTTPDWAVSPEGLALDGRVQYDNVTRSIMFGQNSGFGMLGLFTGATLMQTSVATALLYGAGSDGLVFWDAYHRELLFGAGNTGRITVCF